MRVLRGALILAMLLLAGCGFYLKGKRPLPPELTDVRIHNNDSPVVESELERALRIEVERRGGRIASVADASIINIDSVQEEEQILSLDVDGKVIEYLLTISVKFTLLSDGKPAVPPQTLTAYREYSFDKREIIPAENESREIKDAMYRELAELIMLRLEMSLSS